MEELTAIIIAEPKQYYGIEVQGYIEPTGNDVATLSVVDDSGRVHAQSRYNVNSGMFNAYLQMMTTNLEGTVIIQVKLENANWILSEIVMPRLLVRRVQ